MSASPNDRAGTFSILPAPAPQGKMPRRPLAARLAGRLAREARSMVGIASFLKNEDRRVLEQVIFPHILKDDLAYRNILFVGCDWYTAGYNAWFDGKNYWTIEVDPAMRKFGAKRHIVDGLQNITRHFSQDALDIVICNGVFGWGLDAADDVEQAIRGCHNALRPGGLLIIGVDGVEERRPYALERCVALAAFEPYAFQPLGTADYLTDTPYRHRFLFFRKKVAHLAEPQTTSNVTASTPHEEEPRSQSWLQNQDWSFGSGAPRRILKLLIAELRHFVGTESYLENEDRRVLERVIFPYFLEHDAYQDILFVGCSWCTRGYNKLFESRKNYWTLDNSPLKRHYGAKQHVVAPLQQLRRHFHRGSLDLIICNGVYGWGLNARTEIEAAFTACRESLREDGVLIVGWDDVEKLNPYPLSSWQCLRAFQPFVFPPLGSAEFVTDTPHRHTYSFYRRPRVADLAAQTG